MRLPGWCTECHRTRMVTVDQGWLPHVLGVCDECAERLDSEANRVVD